MNAGFSNLDWLKKNLLSNSFKTDTRFDPLILSLGLGTAGLIENFCNRKFARVVGAQEVFAADQAEFVLSRFPVEAVTTFELKQNEQDGFVAQPNTAIVAIDQSNGIIITGTADVGEYWCQVRFTFTGGFFWEQLEPDDAAYPSVQPAGSTALPEALRTAWLLQCKHIWALNDKLGTDILKTGDEKSLRFPQEWATGVEKTLLGFVRPNFV